MTLPRIPGNEPDPDDMSTEPAFGKSDDNTAEHELPDEEIDKLGNFA